ncbi:MAG: hypothetical protein ACXWZR_19220 [Mycobacterium sp.]
MKSTIYKRNSPRLALLALFAAAIAFGSASVANAEDPSWDVGAYDDCIGREIDYNTERWGEYDINWIITICCQESGGVVSGSFDAPDCVAPGVERSPGAPGGPGAPPKPGGTPPQVSDPGLAPPPTPTTTSLIAPAPAPGLAPR